MIIKQAGIVSEILSKNEHTCVFLLDDDEGGLVCTVPYKNIELSDYIVVNNKIIISGELLAKTTYSKVGKEFVNNKIFINQIEPVAISKAN